MRYMSSGPSHQAEGASGTIDFIEPADRVPAGVGADHGEGHGLAGVDHASGAVGGVVGSDDQEDVFIRDDFIQGIGKGPVQDFNDPLFDARVLGMGGSSGALVWT